MSRLYPILFFFQNRFLSRRWDSFHSPYLFKLFTYCCDDQNDFDDFPFIEQKRKSLLRSGDKIKRIDYGTGKENKNLTTEELISKIARRSLSLPFQCRFLYRLMKLMKPKVILEFGTSLGITASYMAKGSVESMVITVEGDPGLVEKAIEVFSELETGNIQIVNSTFEDYLHDGLQEITSIDFLFLDGNHKSGPLISYYQALRPKFNSSTIVMVDDIYWSKDMQEGWATLIKMPEVTQSVDCYHFGLLFFNPDFLDKENHMIKLPLKSFL